jgi:excisionase family DNA binding protein
MSDLRERLAQERACVAQLSRDEAASALFELGALNAALAARAADAVPQQGTEAQPDHERLLTPAQAAERLGVTRRWLYRNAKRLPFTRKLTPRTLRFHEAGLEKYIRDRKGLTS